MATRIISAIIATAVAIFVLIFSDTLVLNLTLALIGAIIIRELFIAEKCTEYKASYAICMIYVIAMPFLVIDIVRQHMSLFVAICVFALFMTFLLQHKTMSFSKLSFMITTSALVSLSLLFLIYIKNLDVTHGTFYIVIALTSAWFGDAGAYFVGVTLGKHKLCPEISPKKTVEGAVGGVLSTAILMNILVIVYAAIMKKDILNINYIVVSIIGLVAPLLGILGDLTASLIKRQCNIKDYGNIMPGHGGLLDRFDSVLFITPFVYLMLSNFNIFR